MHIVFIINDKGNDFLKKEQRREKIIMLNSVETLSTILRECFNLLDSENCAG